MFFRFFLPLSIGYENLIHLKKGENVWLCMFFPFCDCCFNYDFNILFDKIYFNQHWSLHTFHSLSNHFSALGKLLRQSLLKVQKLEKSWLIYTHFIRYGFFLLQTFSSFSCCLFVLLPMFSQLMQLLISLGQLILQYKCGG